jgi:hypothetical protein
MFYGSNETAVSRVPNSGIERTHSSIVPDQVTTDNLGEEGEASDREEAEEGHAEVHREVEVPAVGSSVEEPHVDDRQEGEGLERLVREVAACHDLPNATADPGGHHNFLAVVVHRNFHLPGVVDQLEPANAALSQDNHLIQVEAARKNYSTAAYPAVRILVDLACLASAEVVRS